MDIIPSDWVRPAFAWPIKTLLLLLAITGTVTEQPDRYIAVIISIIFFMGKLLTLSIMHYREFFHLFFFLCECRHRSQKVLYFVDLFQF